MKILEKGDEIRVIAPSQSWGKRKYQRGYERAKERLESIGYKVTYGKSVKNVLHFGTATREDRANDFNEAYMDKNVKLVMALSGGWSANEVLPLIDWQVVITNPKPLIGFSDITILLNAIYAKTGVSGFLGPNFSTFGRMPEWQYTFNNFSMVMQGSTSQFVKSRSWGESGRKRHKTKGWQALETGEANATLLGGNLGTFYLLQGTEYQPKFNEPFIFLLEDDDEASSYTAVEVSRRFESLLQLPNFRDNLQGLMVGRFQKGSNVSEKDIASIIASKNLGSIPIAYNVDFGHTLPMLTLPIGQNVSLRVNSKVGISLS
jgi:muramoyltetrapeptide carboxypeptidase LdcA involved in peptidoglycan recycling